MLVLLDWDLYDVFRAFDFPQKSISTSFSIRSISQTIFFFNVHLISGNFSKDKQLQLIVFKIKPCYIKLASIVIWVAATFLSITSTEPFSWTLKWAESATVSTFAGKGVRWVRDLRCPRCSTWSRCWRRTRTSAVWRLTGNSSTRTQTWPRLQCECWPGTNLRAWWFAGRGVRWGRASPSARCSTWRLCWPTIRTSGAWLWTASWSTKTQTWLRAHCKSAHALKPLLLVSRPDFCFCCLHFYSIRLSVRSLFKLQAI